MSKERTVFLRTTSFSVEAGEAAVGARRRLSVASDEKERSADARLAWKGSEIVALLALPCRERRAGVRDVVER
jgi:hypothetical protein